MIMKMIFKKEIRDPKLLMKIGMLCLAISIAWPRLVPLTGRLGSDAVDGIKGLLLGLSLGLFFWAGRLGGFGRRDSSQ
jgi:hypothetical protein